MDQTTTSELWRHLEVGTWTVVDRFDRDHKRYLVAQENAVVERRSRALTHRERAVVEYASRGWSNKVIAYELGVSSSTVSTHLSRAGAKLGLRSRTAVIQTFVALSSKSPTPSVAYVRWTDKQFAVLAMPMGPQLPAGLSPAEREVVALVLAGKSNVAIAQARSVSARTIENQLSAAMKKLRVSSRASLVAALAE